MPTRYITDDNKELIVDDSRILESIDGKKYGPDHFNIGSWKLIGYIPPGKKSVNYLTDEFQPGCRMLFLDADEEALSYRSPELGVYERIVKEKEGIGEEGEEIEIKKKETNKEKAEYEEVLSKYAPRPIEKMERIEPTEPGPETETEAEPDEGSDGIKMPHASQAP